MHRKVCLPVVSCWIVHLRKASRNARHVLLSLLPGMRQMKPGQTVPAVGTAAQATAAAATLCKTAC